VVDAVGKLKPDLKHLEGLVVALLNGAQEGWRHFTTEFAEGGAIASLSESEQELYQMSATNDISEGLLGAKRKYLRRAPSHSESFFNGVMMIRYNNTSSWIRKRIGHDKKKGRWLRQHGRLMTMGRVERAWRRRLVEADAKRVRENRVKIRKRLEAKQKREEDIKKITARTKLSLDKEWVQNPQTMASQLNDQLTVWMLRYPDLPKVKSKPKATKVSTGLAAINRYNAESERTSPDKTVEERGDVEMEDGEEVVVATVGMLDGN
jgi:hypothetical protein